jgi:glycosyltransferase involved in cell wall biosynthesis
VKIGLYIGDGTGDGVGGAELMMGCLASAWSRCHDVTLVHHRPALTRERFEAFSNEDYGRVRFRCVPREEEPSETPDLVQRFRRARAWHRSISAGYDLFVNCGHWMPPFCHAKAGLLVVLFPFYIRPHDVAEMRALPYLRRIRHRAYYEFEWRRRLAGYGRTVAISQFAAVWTRRRWAVAPAVVYPPVDVDCTANDDKDDLILSISRFNLRARKKQLEMMKAFAAFQARAGAAWRYASVGGLNATPDNHTYFAEVESVGRGCGATVEANLPLRQLDQLRRRARIFWHAMGLDENTDAYPERAEHFGISTVEAMAAGAVPVVIDKGGQTEIVEHGRSGFLWKTIEELIAYTTLLTRDRALWARMSAAARLRAQTFGRERFLSEISAVSGVPIADMRRRRAA